MNSKTDNLGNDMISRQTAKDYIDSQKGRPFIGCTMGEAMKIMLDEVPPAQPGCEDAVPRTSVEYICRKNTVSTNPYEHKYHDKFIQFMDDPEISDFGRWKHSNGFNTALLAVKCDLDKVPSVTPKQPGWISVTERLPTENNSYLVWMPFTPEGHHITVAEWCGSYWNIKTPIMAWMPLPKPWEEEKAEGAATP